MVLLIQYFLVPIAAVVVVGVKGWFNYSMYNPNRTVIRRSFRFSQKAITPIEHQGSQDTIQMAPFIGLE